jgi:hypothetical protein
VVGIETPALEIRSASLLWRLLRADFGLAELCLFLSGLNPHTAATLLVLETDKRVAHLEK